MKETYENLQVLLQISTMWRTPVEYMCWPKGYSTADCAARRIR